MKSTGYMVYTDLAGWRITLEISEQVWDGVCRLVNSGGETVLSTRLAKEELSISIPLSLLPAWGCNVTSYFLPQWTMPWDLR